MIIRQGFAVVAALITAQFIYPIDSAHAKRDPDEIKMSCTVPTAQITKGLATLARQEAEYAGYEKVKASIKLKRLDPPDRDTYYAEDYLRVKLKGDGLRLKLKPKVNVKFDRCSQFFNITIKITAQSASGKKVTGSATTEDVEIAGFYQ